MNKLVRVKSWARTSDATSKRAAGNTLWDNFNTCNVEASGYCWTTEPMLISPPPNDGPYFPKDFLDIHQWERPSIFEKLHLDIPRANYGSGCSKHPGILSITMLCKK